MNHLLSRPAQAFSDTLAGEPRLGGNRVGLEAVRSHLQAADLEQGLTALSGPFGLTLALKPGTELAAVDRFAIRSLCWRLVGGQLHVHERADVLAALEPRAEILPQSVFNYLYFHSIPSPDTIFAGVHRIPAGHYLLCKGGQVSVKRYWVPRFEDTRGGNLSALTEEFRALLKQAVATQLDGSKAACFLSGGTDSSTVTGMIRQAGAGQAHCYSIGFEAEGYDEMAYARLAAQHFGGVLHEHYVTPDELVQSIPLVAAHYDQPFGNSSAVPAYHCALMAKADGVSRILAGDGGDELFGGNARYAKQRIFGWYGGVPTTLQRHLVEPLLLRTPLQRAPLFRKAASYVEQARVPMPDRLEMYNLLCRVGPSQVLTDTYLEQVDTLVPGRHQNDTWRAASTDSALNRTLAFDWRYTLAETDLPKVTGTTALAGLEVGFPLLDQALLEFSMKLAPDYKLKGLQLRWFFKEALRGFLPDDIITKKKHGFGLPFGVWATRHAGLMRLAQDSLDGLVSRGIVRGDFVHTLLRQHLPAHPGYYGEMVWILMMLEQWLRAWPQRRS